MRITNRDIANDVEFVIQELKNTEVEIPSFWQCARPGLLVMISFMSWQIFVAKFIPEATSELGALAMATLISFIIFICMTASNGKYLSLPLSVRQNSLMIRLVKNRARRYGLLWGSICLCAGLIVIGTQWSSMALYLLEFVSLFLFWFIYIADVGRYDLSLLSAAINTWHSGGNMSAVQQPVQPAAAPGATHHTEQ